MVKLPDRLSQARRAFAQQDLEAMKKAHDSGRIKRAGEEHGRDSHQYLGDLIYGGLDGIVTTFAVVSGVVGANLDTRTILILGLANLLADGLSMGTGAYLSTKSDREYYDRERSRELYEVQNFPEGEREELIEVYEKKGYSHEDAAELVRIQSKHPELWVDAMMVHELGLLPDERTPMLSALATFVSFAIAGSIPLLVYVLGGALGVPAHWEFPLAIALTGLALFGLGAGKHWVTQRSWLRSGLEMLLVGGIAAAVAYLIGFLLRGLGPGAL